MWKKRCLNFTKLKSVQPANEKTVSVIIIIIMNWSYCELFWIKIVLENKWHVQNLPSSSFLKATHNSHTTLLANKNVNLKQVPYSSQTDWVDCNTQDQWNMKGLFCCLQVTQNYEPLNNHTPHFSDSAQ